MINRKNRPVLYEVIRRAQKGSGSWLPRSSALSREMPPGPAEAVRPISATASTAPSNAAQGPVSSWVSEMLEGHVRITLSYPMLAGVAVALLVLLVVSFEIGRRVGAPAPIHDSSLLDDASSAGDPSRKADAASTASREPVHVPNRSESPPNRPGESAGAPPAPKKSEIVAPDSAANPKDERAPAWQLQSGMSYVQIQIFGLKDRDKVNAAAQFLISKGIDCGTLTRKADIVLLARQPFNLSQKDATAKKREQAAADALVKKIRDLGKEYAKLGGGYRFEFAEPKEFGK